MYTPTDGSGTDSTTIEVDLQQITDPEYTGGSAIT